MITEKLILTNEALFPITHDETGKLRKKIPNTGFSVSGTIQGEGKLLGTPSLFLRLSGCNLRCIWNIETGGISRCDTAYSVFKDKIEKKIISVDVIFNMIKSNIRNMNHLVITGGEPMLQAKYLIPLCKKVKNELNLHITLETNGTIYNDELANYIDLFSLSPKLKNSIPSIDKLSQFDIYNEKKSIIAHERNRVNIDAIQQFNNKAKINNADIQYKFVVTKKDEANEIINDFISKIKGINNADILIMPLGSTQPELNRNSKVALQMCLENNWRFCPREHINLFGAKQGV